MQNMVELESAKMVYGRYYNIEHSKLLHRLNDWEFNTSEFTSDRKYNI